MWGGTPTRMRSNAVGGGNSYFMLGVGGCNYDASTLSGFIYIPLADFFIDKTVP
jgi:hypothetical protein